MSTSNAPVQHRAAQQSPSRVLRQSSLENDGRSQKNNEQSIYKRKLPTYNYKTTEKRTKRSFLTQGSALKTPVRLLDAHRTPRSRRVIATPRAPLSERTEPVGYEGILNKQWKTYSLSPLFNFRTEQNFLTKYSRSLDAALCQELSSKVNPLSTSAVKCHFSVYQGLTYHESDPDAIQIQMTEKNVEGRGSTIVFRAFLVCLGLNDNPLPEHLRGRFTYYPVFLVAGNKTRTDILLDWLERHFDCRSGPLTFTATDLRWLLVTGCGHISAVKPPPILLQYSLSGVCDGINTIDCKFEAAFCKTLWERLLGSSKEEINEEEVNTFVDTLEEHLEKTMHIIFRKLNLSEVGTSVAFVSSLGKIKIFSRDAVFSSLNLICDVARDRFAHFQ